MEEIAGLGPLQFNHVWMVTLHSAESRNVLATRSELVVKGKRCLVIDPSVRELTVKVHWMPIPTPDEVIKQLLTPFGRVKRVEREMWRREGFGNLETTTRNVTMIMGDGVGPEKLSHQGNIDSTKVLFSVPGRPPLCLRCEKVGHMRRQCVAPGCRVCRGFGHEPEQCTRSYADMTRGARRPEHFGEQLDNADMEELETHAVSLPNIVENVDDQPCGASEGDKVIIVEATAAAAGEATASPAPVAIELEETGEATNASFPPTFVDGEPECVAKDRGDIAVVDRDLGDDGRCATADCLIGDQLIRFISVYAPNSLSERRVFFETMRHMLDTPGDIVLGGDFNCVLSSTDRAGGVAGKDSSATTLRDVLRDNDLVDVTSRFPGFMPRYTRWQGRSHARLDRLYVSGGLLAGASHYSVKMVPFSDHGLVTTELRSDVATKRRGRRSWKMNMAILDSQEFSARVQQRLENFGRVVDACTWEAFKENLRELAEAFSHTKATEARQEEQALTGTLRIILEEEEKRPGTFAEDIRHCKTRLQEVLEERLRGTQECDASTHHAFLHELATVPEDIKDLINAPIRESEVRRAIKRLSGTKAPGPDGIGAELYKRWMVGTTGRNTRGADLRFYAEIAASVEFFLVHFSWEYLFAASRKTLYWDTLAIVLPVPLYRMETAPPCAAGLFERVRRFPVPASTKDFFVRLHLEVLPVKVWLDARGVFVPWSTNCDLCGATVKRPPFAFGEEFIGVGEPRALSGFEPTGRC
ncbi:hypothetical protein ISCGN_002857 [Ixodes scapularis]